MKQLKYIQQFLTKTEVRQILLLFLVWRVWTFVFALLGTILVPVYSRDFFGGGLEHYLENPIFWSWANFDGEHYISLVQHGYQKLTHSFFPFYPLVVRVASSESIVNITVVGILISSLSLLIGISLFWKLVRIDFSPKVAWYSLVSLVVFPTSFYFGAFYTESLFFLLVVGSFLAARRSKWLLSGVLGALASSTRIIGIFLLPALVVEWFLQSETLSLGRFSLKNVLRLLSIFTVSFGLVSYVFYLYKTTGDPFSFYTDLSPYGVQRASGTFVFLPQVFWRYVKMILTVDKASLFYLTLVMEFLTGAGVLLLIVLGYIKRVRLSYLVFVVLSYILPTLTGSFSSVPRYVLVLFPLFIIMAIFLSERRMLIRILTLSLLIILLIIETMLFVRGYWVG